MNRPSRVQTYMSLAHDYAKRSTCMRLNVGCVIVVNRNPVAFGYNGVPSNQPHCRGNECPGKNECHETIHAEVNAIVRWNAWRQVSRDHDVPADMFCTDSPCPDCVGTILHHKSIRRVFYAYPYRITDYLKHLTANGIKVYRVLPAGYIMNWATNELEEIEI